MPDSTPLGRGIKLYVNKGLHLSLGYKTPEQVFKKGA